MDKKYEIPLSSLYWHCDESHFDFKTTSDLKPLKGIIGQERALKSLDFGLGVLNNGYNIYVLGDSGTGKESVVKDLLKEKAATEPSPDDLCYVFNFNDSDKPAAIILPSGDGVAFKNDMFKLVEALLKDIPQVFESKDYESHRDEILDGQQERTKNIFNRVDRKCDKDGFKLKRSAGGLTIIAIDDSGKSLKDEDFKKFTTSQKEKMEAKLKVLQTLLGDAVREVREVEKSTKDRLNALDREVVQYVVNPYMTELLDKYSEFEDVVAYLKEVKEDIYYNIDDFRVKEESGFQIPGLKLTKDEPVFTRYEVNLLVNNKGAQGAPVVFETNPTYYNLFGRLEYKMQYGVATTDFTMLKSGSIHRANGGYLVLNAMDVLRNIFVYDGLKRMIKNKELGFEDVWEQYRLVSSSTIKPEPVKTNIKIILIGEPYIYYLLYNLDREYRELFKVKVDFDNIIEKNETNIKGVAEFIAGRCDEHSLLPFNKSGVAKVVEYGVREARHKGKISSRFGDMDTVLIEASHYASQDSKKSVSREYVEKAVLEKKYRHSKIEEKLREYITEDTIMVDVDGSVVGQVNGLAVIDMGDYDFGKPSRVTARTYMGDKGVVNIEREAKMSGKIYNKSHLILTSFLGNRYARDFPMTLNAFLCFEQLYEGIEGDSATCAEVYALISSLADVPLKQNIAITGSMNQLGEVQPIGGVNVKIEGFYKICKEKGFTGTQGVIIPERNIKNLMLNSEVLESVEKGEFTIYAINHIDEGLSILTGMEAGTPDEHGLFKEGTVNNLAYNKLKELARHIKDFAKGPLKKKKKDMPDDNGDDDEDENDKDGEKL